MFSISKNIINVSKDIEITINGSLNNKKKEKMIYFIYNPYNSFNFWTSKKTIYVRIFIIFIHFEHMLIHIFKFNFLFQYVS